MDWAETETTRSAGVLLPWTTVLESDGTRLDFTGRAVRCFRAVEPPSGLQGWEVLAMLAAEAGVGDIPGSVEAMSAVVAQAVRETLGGMAAFYWNEDGHPEWDGRGELSAVQVRGRPAQLCPPLTAVGHYKAQIREVGTERFRVK
jgi:anaerobic selenocysteine-containing dehydrogenase